MRQWSTIGSMIWACWLVFFLLYELYSGIEPKRDIPMLTQFVVRYIPWWFTLSLIVWLFCHFAKRYFNPAYIQALKNGMAGG